jgi:hypothetical protein
MKKSFFLLFVCILGTIGPMVVRAQGGSGNIISRDAIGLRVSPNPEHYSPLEWYNLNIKIKGAPQSLIVDGYEAVRDGRTVYVNGAKIAQVSRCSGSNTVCVTRADCGGGVCAPSLTPELYTNVYIISYNQQPESSTTDIFGQLLQFWKFNPDIKNCSNDAAQLCATDSECTSGAVCQQTGFCSQTQTKACLLDSDCGVSEYCNNKKSAIIRDVKRLADLRTAKDRLDKLNNVTLSYPTLSKGTYLTNRTISTWPSWQDTFKPATGFDLPSDPINKLGLCGGGRFDNYDPKTCWDELAKKYSAVPDPLTLPPNSFAYFYQYGTAENTFKICGISESGFVQGRAVGSPICQNNACTSCTGKQCGTNGCGVGCGSLGGSCASGQVCYKYQCRRSGSILDLD